MTAAVGPMTSDMLPYEHRQWETLRNTKTLFFQLCLHHRFKSPTNNNSLSLTKDTCIFVLDSAGQDCLHVKTARARDLTGILPQK